MVQLSYAVIRTVVFLFYLLIPTLILLHLYVSPYTKVEESFNIQAIHDILIHGIPYKNADQFFTANYDHVSFPGSVPRTFVGALILSGLSRPFLGYFSTPASVQLLVRAVLGGLNSMALVMFARSVQKSFGTSAGIWYALFQASQFHIIYYASRTLPNTFALIFSTLALRSLVTAYAVPWSSTTAPRHYRLCLYLLTFAGVVFRSELALLVGTITLYLFASRRISITHIIIPAGLAGLIIGLASTVLIDSFFWQSIPLWPEWTAFYYNTIEGHSADWGVSPWFFYFVNALPRLMMNPATYLLCIPVAVLYPATRRRSLDLLVPLLSFIGLYSFLPHKEWRFIVYVIPGLTAVAGAGASAIWMRRTKSVIYTILSLGLIGSVLLSFTVSTAILAISNLNYPGGQALHLLHSMYHPQNSQLKVHFDNLACQTGVTRFLENHYGPQTVLDVLEAQDVINKRGWIYSKTEDPETLLDPMFWAQFDYVLAERPEKVIGNWEIIQVVYGFGGVRVLKPGEAGGSPAEPLDVIPSAETLYDALISKVAGFWRTIEELLRERFLRGWWVEIKMEPRIRILENRMTVR